MPHVTKARAERELQNTPVQKKEQQAPTETSGLKGLSFDDAVSALEPRATPVQKSEGGPEVLDVGASGPGSALTPGVLG
jgi:hypothetical protein